MLLLVRLIFLDFSICVPQKHFNRNDVEGGAILNIKLEYREADTAQQRQQGDENSVGKRHWQLEFNYISPSNGHASLEPSAPSAKKFDVCTRGIN